MKTWLPTASSSSESSMDVSVLHTYQPTKPSSRDSVTQKSGINVRLAGQWESMGMVTMYRCGESVLL